MSQVESEPGRFAVFLPFPLPCEWRRPWGSFPVSLSPSLGGAGRGWSALESRLPVSGPYLSFGHAFVLEALGEVNGRSLLSKTRSLFYPPSPGGERLLEAGGGRVNRCADLAPPLAGDLAVSSNYTLWDGERGVSGEFAQNVDQRDRGENAYHFWPPFSFDASFEVIGLDLPDR